MPSINQDHTIFISQITPVEIASAFARRLRENNQLKRYVETAQKLLVSHVARDYKLVLLSSYVTDNATTLLYNHPLRAYDAVQLASADVINKRLASNGHVPLIFVASDNRLLDVATEIGLSTDNPNRYA